VDGDRVRVSTVRRGSPAEDAGICPGDEIIAVDGLRADVSTTSSRLHDHAPGDAISVTLFRRDELHQLSLIAARPILDTFTIVEPPEAIPAVHAWVGDIA
jgi:predicted metalloprotease with PDZ domain